MNLFHSSGNSWKKHTKIRKHFRVWFHSHFLFFYSEFFNIYHELIWKQNTETKDIDPVLKQTWNNRVFKYLQPKNFHQDTSSIILNMAYFVHITVLIHTIMPSIYHTLNTWTQLFLLASDTDVNLNKCLMMFIISFHT